jgi:predicted small secreted protein
VQYRSWRCDGREFCRERGRQRDLILRYPTQSRRLKMVQKILTGALIGAAMLTAACNTVRGAARDVNSVANCTENAIEGQSC